MNIHYGVEFTVTDRDDIGIEEMRERIEWALYHAGIGVGPIGMIDRRSNRRVRKTRAMIERLKKEAGE